MICWKFSKNTEICEFLRLRSLATKFLTRKHSSRMRTVRLPTLRVLVVTTRCQYQWGKVVTHPTPWTYSPTTLDIPTTPNIPTPSGHTHALPLWDTTPNRMTDTCENITFPQVRSRPVKCCEFKHEERVGVGVRVVSHPQMLKSHWERDSTEILKILEIV